MKTSRWSFPGHLHFKQMNTHFQSLELFSKLELMIILQYDEPELGKKYLRLEFICMNVFINCGVSLNA